MGMGALVAEGDLPGILILRSAAVRRQFAQRPLVVTREVAEEYA
jgi:hypothetical protein